MHVEYLYHLPVSLKHSYFKCELGNVFASSCCRCVAFKRIVCLFSKWGELIFHTRVFNLSSFLFFLFLSLSLSFSFASSHSVTMLNCCLLCCGVYAYAIHNSCDSCAFLFLFQYTLKHICEIERKKQTRPKWEWMCDLFPIFYLENGSSNRILNQTIMSKLNFAWFNKRMKILHFK